MDNTRLHNLNTASFLLGTNAIKEIKADRLYSEWHKGKRFVPEWAIKSWKKLYGKQVIESVIHAAGNCGNASL